MNPFLGRMLDLQTVRREVYFFDRLFWHEKKHKIFSKSNLKVVKLSFQNVVLKFDHSYWKYMFTRIFQKRYPWFDPKFSLQGRTRKEIQKTCKLGLNGPKSILILIFQLHDVKTDILNENLEKITSPGHQKSKKNWLSMFFIY